MRKKRPNSSLIHIDGEINIRGKLGDILIKLMQKYIGEYGMICAFSLCSPEQPVSKIIR